MIMTMTTNVAYLGLARHWLVQVRALLVVIRGCGHLRGDKL